MFAAFSSIHKWISITRCGKCSTCASLHRASIERQNIISKQKTSGQEMVSTAALGGLITLEQAEIPIVLTFDYRHSFVLPSDPAFVAIMVYFMAIAALGFTIAFHRSMGGFLKGILYAVIVDFGLVGVLAATLGWYLANQYLLVENLGSHTTDQKVEWLYSFDIHCNSFFPFFILLYVIQYSLLMLFLREGFVFTLLANVTYAVAFCYYLYVTFLGYDVLPFLQHTTVFLYPIAVVAVVFIIACLFKFNMCIFVMNSYFG